MTSNLLNLDCVANFKGWNDRTYITLAGVNRAAKADITTKIWLRGNVLTIETGKGYHSDEFIASKEALVAVAEADGIRVVNT